MASISQRKDGSKVVSFVRADGERKHMRLGKMELKLAEKICTHIGHLNNAQIVGHPIETETATWLAKAGKPLYDKLARFGLVAPRVDSPKAAKATLAALVDGYIAKRTDVKGGTATVYKRCRKHLVGFFGAEKPLDEITQGDAKDWRIWLAETQKLAKNTVGRTCGIAKQFFHDAIDRELIAKNPFAKLSAQVGGNKEREYFIPRSDAELVLAACPDAQWRLLFALSRFGGMRCPSEHLALRWDDVNWERNRMTIRSPKTEHHEGGDCRVCPIFPELRPYLDAVWDEAPEGTEYVITRYREPNVNLRTQLQKIIARAGLKPWPKLFQNLRATRETELLNAGHSIHTVCAWLGNTPKVALKHYAQVTEADFEKVFASAPLAPLQPVPGQRTESHDLQIHRESELSCANVPVQSPPPNGRHRTRTPCGFYGENYESANRRRKKRRGSGRSQTGGTSSTVAENANCASSSHHKDHRRQQ